MEMPPFALTADYGLFLLSITLTTLGVLFVGGMLRGRFRGGAHSFRKKLFFFPLFIVGIFAMGWFTERMQQGVYAYLKQNIASSIPGLIIAILVAWLLYDFVLWRRK